MKSASSYATCLWQWAKEMLGVTLQPRASFYWFIKLLYNLGTINGKVFEVEIVLLRTLWVKRNAGRGTPAKYLSVYWII